MNTREEVVKQLGELLLSNIEQSVMIRSLSRQLEEAKKSIPITDTAVEKDD